MTSQILIFSDADICYKNTFYHIRFYLLISYSIKINEQIFNFDSNPVTPPPSLNKNYFNLDLWMFVEICSHGNLFEGEKKYSEQKMKFNTYINIFTVHNIYNLHEMCCTLCMIYGTCSSYHRDEPFSWQYHVAYS